MNQLLEMLHNELAEHLLTRILASMTASSKHTDSTKNVLKLFCTEKYSMIISRRDRTELVASYT